MSSEAKRWTIYNAPDWDDAVFGPPTGKDGVEVAPASEVKRLRSAIQEHRTWKAKTKMFRDMEDMARQHHEADQELYAALADEDAA